MSAKSFEDEENEPLQRRLHEDDTESDISAALSPPTRSHKARVFRLPSIIGISVIIILTIFTIFLSLRVRDLERKIRELKTKDALNTYLNSKGSQKDTCVFPTDLKDATKHIKYEERVFTGFVKSNMTKDGPEVYHDVPEGELRYFGDPAIFPEIDGNWKNLLGNEFFGLSDEEAQPFPQKNFLKVAAVSVFHGLHCVNAIRQHMDRDYYVKHGGLHQGGGPGYPLNWNRAHMSHCLDQIRQLIQCSGDLSPVPLYKHEEITVENKTLNIAQGAKHTCRSFDKIKLWMIEREMYGFGDSFGEYSDDEK